MTPLQKTTDIPSNIQTVEALTVWCMEVLQNAYPEAETIEFLDENGDPLPRRTVEANKFFYTAVTPGVWRHSSRVSIEIDKAHQVSGHVWDHAKPIGNAAIPAGMKT